jgi:hypothetical protein
MMKVPGAHDSEPSGRLIELCMRLPLDERKQLQLQIEIDTGERLRSLFMIF